MSITTLRYRARLAIPLAMALLTAPWLLPDSGSQSIAVLPKVAELPCDLAQAVTGNHVRGLQLPGDLPLHLRLRISCSSRS
ncbi:MAG: hypothetical protein CVV12_05595 [Gammaproteobacteria bacterium HGW-Gammaproteobacteria-2]|jgi:hypothetical protein|nr:MAG: hypothetical protein CVV12_05595 [Gammaproteobacteria bacterium HGW-Gammaproteobacteria-2]